MLIGALLLCCVCLVYAHGGLGPLGPLHYKDNDSVDPGFTIYDSSEGKVVQYPLINPIKIQNNPLTDDDTNRSPIDLLNNVPQPWISPPFNKSLQNFEDGLELLKRHYSKNAFQNKHSVEFDHAVLLGVIDKLSAVTAQRGWSYYSDNYENLVIKFTEEVIYDPLEAIRMTECTILQPTIVAVVEVKRVIQNPAVQFVCKIQPLICDSTIWAILQLKPTNKIKHGSKALIAAGKAAALYLYKFSAIFDVVSKQNVYKYLLGAKDELVPLVFANARVRNIVNPYGDVNCGLKTQPPGPQSPFENAFRPYANGESLDHLVQKYTI